MASAASPTTHSEVTPLRETHAVGAKEAAGRVGRASVVTVLVRGSPDVASVGGVPEVRFPEPRFTVYGCPAHAACVVVSKHSSVLKSPSGSAWLAA